MMMRKKIMAMMTAMGMLAGMVTFPVSAEYNWRCIVLSIDYAEDGVTPETYLVIDDGQWKTTVTAEEMEYYLTTDSAQPQIGDVLDVDVNQLDQESGAEYTCFVFTEDSTIQNLGKADEIWEAPRSYVLLREWDDSGCFLMQDVESGDRKTYTMQHYPGYTTPYNMEGAEIGDTVSFYHSEYGNPLLPITVTKGDGTIPELPEAVIRGEYHTSPAIVIGAQYVYGSVKPAGYLLSMGGTEMQLYAGSLFEHMDTFAYPECGDVLMIDYEMIAETYPGKYCFPQNAMIRNVGKAAELYGTKTYTVTKNEKYQLSLTAEDGSESRYSYWVAEFGWELYHSDAARAQVGDTLTFMLDEKGDPVVPITETELDTPVREFAVIAVDDADAPQNYVIYSLDDEQDNYCLTADVLAACLAEGEKMPEFGDILKLTGYLLPRSTSLYRTFEFTLQMPGENLGSYVNDGIIHNLGSVFDDCEEVQMQYAKEGEFDYYYCKFAYPDGKNVSYPCDFLETFVQPDCADLTKMNYGDSFSMVFYNDVPVFPAKTVSRLGDVNKDDRIDSSDAAVLLLAAANEGVMGVSALTDVQKTAADLNADGTCNAADAAIILHYAAYLGTGGTLEIGEYLEEILVRTRN